MSKKRGRSKQKRAHKLETSSGVPSEEILAEGSGPVGEGGEIPPVQAADETDDTSLEAAPSVDADAPALTSADAAGESQMDAAAVDGASEPASDAVSAADADVEAVSEEAAAAASGSGEPASKTKKGAELGADVALRGDSDAGSDSDSESDDVRKVAEINLAGARGDDESFAEAGSSDDAVVSAEVDSDALSVLDAPSAAEIKAAELAEADLVASAADTALVASAIDAAFADVVRANPVPTERPLDDAAPAEMFAEGSLGTDFPSPEPAAAASDAAPEPMLASGSMSNFAAARDDQPGERERSMGDAPAGIVADDATEHGNLPAEPVTE